MNKEEVEAYFTNHFFRLAKEVSQSYFNATKKPQIINIRVHDPNGNWWFPSTYTLHVYELENKNKE